MKNLQLSILILFLPVFSFTQQLIDSGHFEYIPENHECLSEAARDSIKKENLANIKKLGLDHSYPQRLLTLLDWPLRQANGFNDPDYYLITNFVDHNSGAGILDYNCGSRTYDGHRGTDIVVWPWMWHKMKVRQVEVIAGQAGTIINKFDGNFDMNCTCTGSWNAVYVMHADGSVAWYGHLKTGSLTNKIVGQTVAKGEYLGSVGSSGCSTAPHLHLELYQNAAQTILIDPFGGACNSLNGNTSWWQSQKPYTDPQLLKIMIHDCSSLSQNDGCPANTYEMCEQYSLSAGSTVLFSSHFRQQQSGQVTNYIIKRPDGSTFASWAHNNPTTYTYGSWWWWSYAIPSTGPYGTWTFEVTDEGVTTVKPFEVILANTNNIGIGENRPGAKLNVNQGDVYVENIGSGVIIRSANGRCWRITVNNSGTMTATSVMCPD